MKLVSSMPGPRFMKARDMAIGQIGIVISNGPDKGAFLLRTYSDFVDLLDPSNCWSNGCTLEVQLIPAGTQLTFETV